VDLAHLLHLRAVALSGPDHLDLRMQAVTELLALPGLPTLMTARARQLHAWTLVTSGRVPEAATELELASGQAEEQHPPLRTRLAWSRAGLLLLGGRWRDADELSRAIHDEHARTSRDEALSNRLMQRWESAYLTGTNLDDVADELRSVAASSARPALHAILLMALVETGQVRDARSAVHRFPQEPEEDHLWLYTRCWALLAASRLGETELVTGQRAALLPYRGLTPSVLDLAISGSVAYFTGEAAMALGDHDAAVADLDIAAKTTQRMGAQPWLAKVRDTARRARKLRTSPAHAPRRR
jgi:hypothetical protein